MEQEITYGPIQLVLGLGSLVCLILAWVQMFKQSKVGLGILSIITTFVCGIGGLIAFIWGWMHGNVNAKIMIVWTLLIVAGILAGVAGV